LTWRVNSQSCSFSKDDCKVKFTGGANDGLELDLSEQGQVTSTTSNDGRTYYFAPCGLVTTGCTAGVGCQVDGAQFIPMGATAGLSCSVSSDQATINFPGLSTTIDANLRAIDATYVCGSGDLVLAVGQNGKTDVITYPFTLTGSAGCPAMPSGGGGGSGLNGGAIFLIIYFVAIAVYLIAGIIYKAFVKGARGLEVIPNIEFWMTVPGLVKDGCIFIYRSIAAKVCKKEYDSV